jgi:molecular chaperone DnaK
MAAQIDKAVSVGGTWSLAIDFGTTATVGAMLDERTPRIVTVDEDRSIPSTIAWVDGHLLVGREAERRRLFRPDTGVARPKQLLGRRRTILLGDQAVPAPEAVAAILRVVADAAIAQQGRDPVATTLTHPVRWTGDQLGQLVAGARMAELPDVHLLPEPVAAAFHAGLGRVAEGDHVAVYDLGGGTFDTAVLTHSGDSFELTGPPGGDETFGGDDIDARLTGLVLERIDALTPAWADDLRHADDATWRRAYAELTLEVRRAKEALSRQTTTTVALGTPMQGEVRVTRPELEAAIEPDLRRTIDELVATVDRAGLALSDLAATYVTGGASRTPLVSRLLQDALGRPPDTFDDPKSVVALGANQWYARTHARRSDPEPPPTAEPIEPEALQSQAAPAEPTEPSPGRRPMVVWLVGAGLVLGAIVVGLVALFGGGNGGSDATIAVDGSPTGLTFGDGSAWTALDDTGSVVRIDAGSNEVVDEVATGEAPLGLTYGGDAVWATDEDTNSVVRIDPTTTAVVATIAVGRRPLALTADGRDVWVANYDDGTVTRIDASTNAVVATITVGRGPIAITASDGVVWVANGGDDSVTRLDPQTNRKQVTIPVGSQPLAIAAGAGAVWVTSFADGTVMMIEPDRNLVEGQITVGAGPAALVFDGDALWVANSRDDSVMKVNTGEMAVTRTLATGGGPAALAVGDGSIWVANAVGRSVSRLATG